MEVRTKYNYSNLVVIATLILSIFVFAGINYSVSAIPQEYVKTELVVSNDFKHSDQVLLLDHFYAVSQFPIRFLSKQTHKGLSQKYSSYSTLIIKIRNSSFLDFKSREATAKTSFQSLLYPSETIDSHILG